MFPEFLQHKMERWRHDRSLNASHEDLMDDYNRLTANQQNRDRHYANRSMRSRPDSHEKSRDNFAQTKRTFSPRSSPSRLFDDSFFRVSELDNNEISFDDYRRRGTYDKRSELPNTSSHSRDAQRKSNSEMHLPVAREFSTEHFDREIDRPSPAHVSNIKHNNQKKSDHILSPQKRSSTDLSDVKIIPQLLGIDSHGQLVLLPMSPSMNNNDSETFLSTSFAEHLTSTGKRFSPIGENSDLTKDSLYSLGLTNDNSRDTTKAKAPPRPSQPPPRPSQPPPRPSQPQQKIKETTINQQQQQQQKQRQSEKHHQIADSYKPQKDLYYKQHHDKYFHMQDQRQPLHKPHEKELQQNDEANIKHRVQDDDNDRIEKVLDYESNTSVEQRVKSNTPSPIHHGLMKNPALNSPHLKSNSPHLLSNSSNVQANSPQLQANSPYLKSVSPHLPPNSPLILSNSPHLQSNSSHLKSNSPHLPPNSPYLQSKDLEFSDEEESSIEDSAGGRLIGMDVIEELSEFTASPKSVKSDKHSKPSKDLNDKYKSDMTPKASDSLKTSDSFEKTEIKPVLTSTQVLSSSKSNGASETMFDSISDHSEFELPSNAGDITKKTSPNSSKKLPSASEKVSGTVNRTIDDKKVEVKNDASVAEGSASFSLEETELMFIMEKLIERVQDEDSEEVLSLNLQIDLNKANTIIG